MCFARANRPYIEQLVSQYRWKSRTETEVHFVTGIKYSIVILRSVIFYGHEQCNSDDFFQALTIAVSKLYQGCLHDNNGANKDV